MSRQLEPSPGPRAEASLCDALDRMLHKGVVVEGEVMLSVAGVDLAYLDLRLLLASVDTVREARPPSREVP